MQGERGGVGQGSDLVDDDAQPGAVVTRPLEQGAELGLQSGRGAVGEHDGQVGHDGPLMLPAAFLVGAVDDVAVGQGLENGALQAGMAGHDKVGITGIMLTRIDGDARGGAALSMRAITGKPIKLLGTGEKLDQLEDFHADRVAGRILGMGDIVSLVEKAMEATEQEEAEKLALKMQKGQFDLNDMAQQMKQLQKMGGLGGIMGMLPGIGKMQKQLEGKMDNKVIGRTLAIISSMTPKERRVPDIIKASRKTRIAKGAGVQVQDVNKLLKQHQEMSRMMKQVSKMGQKGLMRHGMAALMKGGMGGMGGGGFGGMR